MRDGVIGGDIGCCRMDRGIQRGKIKAGIYGEKLGWGDTLDEQQLDNTNASKKTKQ